jgi:hypothetical protein
VIVKRGRIISGPFFIGKRCGPEGLNTYDDPGPVFIFGNIRTRRRILESIFVSLCIFLFTSPVFAASADDVVSRDARLTGGADCNLSEDGFSGPTFLEWNPTKGPAGLLEQDAAAEFTREKIDPLHFVATRSVDTGLPDLEPPNWVSIEAGFQAVSQTRIDVMTHVVMNINIDGIPPVNCDFVVKLVLRSEQ